MVTFAIIVYNNDNMTRREDHEDAAGAEVFLKNLHGLTKLPPETQENLLSILQAAKREQEAIDAIAQILVLRKSQQPSRLGRFINQTLGGERETKRLSTLAERGKLVANDIVEQFAQKLPGESSYTATINESAFLDSVGVEYDQGVRLTARITYPERYGMPRVLREFDKTPLLPVVNVVFSPLGFEPKRLGRTPDIARVTVGGEAHSGPSEGIHFRLPNEPRKPALPSLNMPGGSVHYETCSSEQLEQLLQDVTSLLPNPESA